jgi:hypothetical protein
MEPLSIAASITGILTPAVRVSSLLMQIKDAPTTLTAVLTEVNHMRIIFTALQKFLDRAARVARPRAALIQLEDVVVILTQMVLVFSELEMLIAPLPARDSLSGWRRLNWSRQEAGILRLINQLQRHKISLLLLLQIIQW